MFFFRLIYYYNHTLIVYEKQPGIVVEITFGNIVL